MPVKDTLSGSYAAAITLTTAAYANPLTVTGSIEVTDSIALYGAIPTAWSIVNSGLIRISGTTGDVVQLGTGGTVSNEPSGSISGGRIGVDILHAAGSVNNAGLIESLGTSSYGYGVRLSLGGMLTNMGGGTIVAGSGIIAPNSTTIISTISNQAGALISGLVLGGVDIRASGAIIDNAGTISGRSEGVYFQTGTLTNLSGGTIASPNFTGVQFGGYGVVTNAATATIAAARDGISSGTVNAVIDNSGVIVGSTDIGVILAHGGTISNASSGTISGYKYGVDLESGVRTVLNAGSIVASHGTAVQMQISGTGDAYALNSGSIVGSADGIDVSVNAGSINNYGLVQGIAGLGVRLHDGGTVSNAAGGTIEAGGKYGVFIYQGAASVSNSGSIIASGSTASGVFIRNAGSVDNGVGGLISGVNHGILFSNNSGTVSNAGKISNSDPFDAAIAFDTGGGTLTNGAGGIVSGGSGVYSFGGGTVINAGTIAANGSGDMAANLIGGQSNLVMIEPGGTFVGTVDGGNNYLSVFTSTLELGQGVGTVAGIGTNFIDFGVIAFDAGASWKVSGATVALAGGQMITGFAPGNTIELYNVSESISSFANGTLSLTGAKPLNLLLPGNFTTSQFTATQEGANTDITVACFRAGTRILTANGEIAVDVVRPGMRVFSSTKKALLPITWVGSRRINCKATPHLAPVRIAADAFGAGRPHRSLWLSPDHSVLVDDVLIPIVCLVNGASIAREQCDEVSYFHIELAEHGVLLGEGLEVESYLDTGNRSAFEEFDVLLAGVTADALRALSRRRHPLALIAVEAG